MFQYLLQIQNKIDGKLYQKEVCAKNRAEAVQAAMRELSIEVPAPRHLIINKVLCDLREIFE